MGTISLSVRAASATLIAGPSPRWSNSITSSFPPSRPPLPPSLPPALHWARSSFPSQQQAPPEWRGRYHAGPTRSLRTGRLPRAGRERGREGGREQGSKHTYIRHGPPSRQRSKGRLDRGAVITLVQLDDFELGAFLEKSGLGFLAKGAGGFAIKRKEGGRKGERKGWVRMSIQRK